MNQKELFDKIKNLEESNWQTFRDSKDYDLIDTHIPGLNQKRKIYFVKEKNEKYEMLQCSRGVSIKKSHENISQLQNDIKNNHLLVSHQDEVRIKELDLIFQNENIDFKYEDLSSFCEIGFRIPKLLKYYLENGFKKAIGFDVVNINVKIAENLGYEVFQRDFNNIESCDISKISESDLIVCYHMLEHVSRPDIVIKKIFNSMKEGSFFHVEVPIEDNIPRIRYGHLFPFHPNDLGLMLKDSGFKVMYVTNKTHVGGPWIERYFCRK